jgi:peptidoglycan-N-acetylglucosamine deacetylase
MAALMDQTRLSFRQWGNLMRLIISVFTLALALTSPIAAQKRIALSFDDVPRHTGPDLTRDQRQKMIIAALKKSRVKQAVFFINPAQLLNPEAKATDKHILDYAKTGHVLANHTDNHVKLSDVSAADYLARIDAAESWLKGRKGYRPWFRFTYLDEGGQDKVKRDAVRAGLATRGLRNGYVTAEASDWYMLELFAKAVADGKKVDRKKLCAFYAEHHIAASDFADSLAQKTIGRSPAHVLLLHETDLAAYCLGDLVAGLRKAGWTIITADQAYADPIGTAMPDVPSAQGGLTEAMAWEKGLPAPRWYRYNDIKLLAEDFAKRGIAKPKDSVSPKGTPKL